MRAFSTPSTKSSIEGIERTPSFEHPNNYVRGQHDGQRKRQGQAHRQASAAKDSQGVHRRHVMAVVDEVQPTSRTTAEMHVVGEAVIGGIDRDDGLQLSRVFGGHVQ